MSTHPPHPLMPQRDLPGATAGLVMGILSLVFAAPIIGLLLGIFGMRASGRARALNAAHPGMYTNAGVAEAGYVCSIIGVVLGSITSFCGCLYFGTILLALLGLAGAGAAAGAGG